MYFWPFNISFDYDFKIEDNFWSKNVIFPLIFLLSIILLGLILFINNTSNIFSFCIAWFFVTILPRSSLIPSTEMVSDYKTHLASLSLFLILAIILLKIVYLILPYFKKKKYLISQFTSFLIIFSIFGYLTKQRNKVWSSDLNFWADAIKSAPHKARAHNNYAVALARDGQKDKAIKHYHKALECDPTYGEPHINLAINYQNKGDKKTAMHHYQQALKSGEGHPELFNNLGTLHLENKNYKKAEYCFNKGINLHSFYGRGVYDKALFNLGRTKQEQGDLQKANEYYAKALKGEAPQPFFFFAHAETSYKLNKYDDAIKSLEIAKRHLSGFNNLEYTLGCCYYAKGNYEKACENFKASYNTNSKSNVFAYNYAQSLINLHKYKKALPLFKQCTKTNKYAFAPLLAEKCRGLTGQKDVAIKNLSLIVQKTTNPNLKLSAKSFIEEIKNS